MSGVWKDGSFIGGPAIASASIAAGISWAEVCDALKVPDGHRSALLLGAVPLGFFYDYATLMEMFAVTGVVLNTEQVWRLYDSDRAAWKANRVVQEPASHDERR